jgi:putative NIF3 family GTP cyclohydrolase 1 type 2
MSKHGQKYTKDELRRLARADSSIFVKHKNIDGYLKGVYLAKHRQAGTVAADSWLAGVDERLSFSKAFSWSMGVEGFIEMSDVRGKACAAIWRGHVGNFYWMSTDLSSGFNLLKEYCADFGIELDAGFSRNDCIFTHMKKCVIAARRASSKKWWKRQLLKTSARKVESVLREIGGVRKSKLTPYLSNFALARWRSQNVKNRNLLDQLEMVNQDGEVASMADAVAKSNANPVNRRNELILRMRGYEEVASGLGLDGLFFTLTAPSAFHAYHHSGKSNSKFINKCPRAVAQYLGEVWACIRAEWARNDIKSFGFRVAEPHHDGTPHYHFLLFIEPEKSDIAQEIFGHYALELMGDEAGAADARWDCKKIDPKKGTAAGYIAKYVAKSVDGAHVDWDKDTGVTGDDQTGVTGEEGAERVCAWASIWGIRQFQQIGSVSVTVWREFRKKLSSDPSFVAELEGRVRWIAEAAGASDWSAFVDAMGGPTVARSEQIVRPEYVEAENLATEYGEPVKRLIGLWLRTAARAIGGWFVSTRQHVWKVLDLSGCRELDRKADSFIAERLSELNRGEGFLFLRSA